MVQTAFRKTSSKPHFQTLTSVQSYCASSAMASRCRALSRPAINLFKSTMNKQSSIPASSFHVPRPFPTLSRQVLHPVYLKFLSDSILIIDFDVSGHCRKWGVFNLCCRSTLLSLQLDSHLALVLIPRAPGRCLRVCSAVPIPEFDILETVSVSKNHFLVMFMYLFSSTFC